MPSKTERACVYTVLYGTRDRLPEQPMRAGSGVDFIAFVDDPSLRSASWDVRPLPPLLPADLPRSSRWPRLCAHRVLPEYDVSIYLDATVQLTAPPSQTIDALLGDTPTMACLANDAYHTLEQEAAAAIDHGLDRASVCREQLAAYRATGWRGSVPAIWAGLLIRRHHHPEVVGVMEQWFAHVMRYSRRAQIAFPYVAERAGLAFACHDLPNARSPFHRWSVADRAADGSYRESALAHLDAPERRVAELEHQLAGQVALVRNQAREHAAELARLHGEVTALRTSRSWRVTAPLRRLRGGGD